MQITPQKKRQVCKFTGVVLQGSFLGEVYSSKNANVNMHCTKPDSLHNVARIKISSAKIQLNWYRYQTFNG